MNINDYQPLLISFEDIFGLQKELKFKFEPQAKQDFDNFDLDTFESQEVIKKYAWRITEELTEMLEAYYKDSLPGEKEHVWEEAIDAFNFFIELCNLVGATPESGKIKTQVPEYMDFHFTQMHEYIVDPEIITLKIVYWLGMVCNHLKSREWRKSQYLVDEYRFWPNFQNLWDSFMLLFYIFGWDSKDIAYYYSLKYQVNLFRISTTY